MKRIALISIGSLLSVVILLLTVLASINLNDSPLNENVQAILNSKPQFSEQQKNAFYYMVGLYQRATDPAAEGKKTYEQYLALPDAEKPAFWRAHFAKQTPWEIQYSGCSNQRDGCTIDWVKNHPEELEALKQQPESLQKYIRLIEFGAGADIYQSTDGEPFSMIRMFSIDLHRKLVLQMIQWVSEGQTSKVLDLMEKSNHYNQSLMSSGTLLDRTVAASEIHNTADVLKDILAHQPKIQLPQSLIESFAIQPTKEIFLGAMSIEISFLHFYFVHAKLGDFAVADEDFNSWQRHLLNAIPVSLVLRRNETLNRYADLVTARLNGSPSSDLMDWLTAARIYQYLENPVGRKLVAVFTEQLEARMRRFDLHRAEIDKAHEFFAKRAAGN